MWDYVAADLLHYTFGATTLGSDSVSYDRVVGAILWDVSDFLLSNVSTILELRKWGPGVLRDPSSKLNRF